MMDFARDIRRRVRRAYRRRRGNVFQNQGPFARADFEVIREGIDAVAPRTFVELGTGEGHATAMILEHLERHHPACEFWTVELFEPLAEAARARFAGNPRFHALQGLTVTPEETTDPARAELRDYHGPVNRLRDVLDEIGPRGVDVAFIDSRKGSALAEFKLLDAALNPGGVIFCHDIANWGKAVEVLLYVQAHKDRYDYDVFDTSSEGVVRIRRR